MQQPLSKSTSPSLLLFILHVPPFAAAEPMSIAVLGLIWPDVGTTPTPLSKKKYRVELAFPLVQTT
jgi:hypothetical protein